VPLADLVVQLQVQDDESRVVTLLAHSACGEALLHALDRLAATPD
jgi:esterase/lipase superfamily enzyme